VKKKRKIEMSEKFDIVGNLLVNYGTGENLVRDIFSYLDVSSLQGAHLVCKTWYRFVVDDRKLWMDILRKTEPYFEFLNKRLLKDEFCAVDAKKFFDRVEKNEDFCSQIVIKILKSIQIIHIVLQDVIFLCPVYPVFQKEFIGEKLTLEIQLQIDRVEKKKQEDPKFRFHSRFRSFESRIARLFLLVIDGVKKMHQFRMMEYLTTEEEEIKEELKKSRSSRIIRELLLLRVIKETLQRSCFDA